MQPGLFEAISEKVKAGQPLSRAEIEALAATPDLITLGMLADEARRRRHGETVTFCRVADLVVPADEEIVVEVPEAAGELRLVGNPGSARRAVRFVRAAIEAAGGVPISAFSLADLVTVSEDAATPLIDLLVELREAGLELIAEAPVDALEDAESALAASREAGLRVARLTVRGGTSRDTLEVIDRAKALKAQDERLVAFAPLPRITPSERPTTGYEDVRTIALARLMADTIPTIQVDWALYGPKLAQVALTFGANDVDAVSPHDTQDLGARRAPLAEIRRNIRAASFEPVERDGRFVIRSS
jgi:aminodeoxyfutalosine synthase